MAKKTRNKTAPKQAESLILSKPHDTLFKSLFVRKDIVQSYMKAFCPPGLLSKFNLDGMTLDTNSYIDDKLKSFYSDVAWNLPYKERQVSAVFLFEHKSQPFGYVLLQLLRYMVSIWEVQCLEKNHKRKKLRVVIPIIVYHGNKPWQPKPFEGLFDIKDPDLLKYVPKFDFLFKSLYHATPEELEAIDGDLAKLGIVTMASAFKESFLDDISELYRYLELVDVDSEMSNFLSTILVYYSNVSSMSGQKFIDIIAKTSSPRIQNILMTTAQQLKLEGKLEGETSKELEKNLEFTKSLIVNSDFDDSKIALIVGVEAAFVKGVREKM